MDGNPVNRADSCGPAVPLHWFGVPYALPAGGYPADCTGGPAGEMRRVFPGPGVRVADTESGSGSCFIQFLESERNYLPGRHRGAGSSVHPGNYRDTGTAAGDG